MSKGKRAIREGQSYRVVDVSYTAWVFEQPPSKELIEKLLADPELSKRTAMYDLSGLSQGKTLCLKLNETSSKAFEEFERFLKEKYGITTRPLYEPQTKEPRTFKSKLDKASVG